MRRALPWFPIFKTGLSIPILSCLFFLKFNIWTHNLLPVCEIIRILTGSSTYETHQNKIIRTS